MKYYLIKRFLPIILVVMSMVLFNIMIYHHERHIADGQSVFIDLMPADPRSLIQGDYMQLNYNLMFDEESRQAWERSTIKEHPHIDAWVRLDNQNRLIQTTFSQKEHAIPMILNNPSGFLSQVYPASQSFLFAEGLAACYDQARFAHFKINSSGRLILLELVDEHLQSLGCEEKARVNFKSH